jgi:cobalamin biosynthetic protein CobC
VRLEVIGGTPLYRLTRSSDADGVFTRLGRAGIMVRRFDEESTWLRWGLPSSENDWRRLQDALR